MSVLSRFAVHLVRDVSLALFVALQACSTDRTTATHAGRSCARHGIALVTARGYELRQPWPIVDYGAAGEKACARSPNAVDVFHSLRRKGHYTVPAEIVFCPRCEDELRHWFAAHPSEWLEIQPAGAASRMRTTPAFASLQSAIKL